MISFHPEASQHVSRSLSLIKELGCQAGIALNPATPLSHLDHVMDQVDMVLVMTVNPGFGGQAFMPSMLPKIEAVRRNFGQRSLDSLCRLMVVFKQVILLRLQRQVPMFLLLVRLFFKVTITGKQSMKCGQH